MRSASGGWFKDEAFAEAAITYWNMTQALGMRVPRKMKIINQIINCLLFLKNRVI